MFLSIPAFLLPASAPFLSETVLGAIAGIGIILVLAFDLGVMQRNAHQLSLRAAILWSIFWILFAFAYNGVIYFARGSEPAVEFLSGFLVEKALSVDNLFVFLLIFTYFQVPNDYQHKVLFWGIFGAVLMRGLLIWAGLQLLELFHWLTYVLGAFLIYTGYKTAVQDDDDNMDLSENRLLRFLRRFLPVTKDYVGAKFIVRRGNRTLLTPLFVVLVMIETTDVLFALDSVPAILGITKDPLVLYTSNLFAILGLRALYFVLAGLFGLFHYLRYGVSAVLIFVGGKMMVEHYYPVSDPITLGVIGTLLGVSIWASSAFPQPAASETPSPAAAAPPAESAASELKEQPVKEAENE